MSKLLSTQAASYYNNGDYQSALQIYNRLATDISQQGFGLMAELCALKIGSTNKDKVSGGTDGVKSLDSKMVKKRKAAVFTNLGLNTIDGSTVFISNVTRMLSSVFDQTVLISTIEPCLNIKERTQAGGESIEFITIEPNNIKDQLSRLDSTHNFEVIFVRSWGDPALWHDHRYSKKVIYYWPLHFKPDAYLRTIYNDVGRVAFQTNWSREEAFLHYGATRNIVIPPLIVPPSVRKRKPTGEWVKMCYIGTLRPECFSLELLKAINNQLQANKSIQFTLAIGKILYKDKSERAKVTHLLDCLAENGANIEHQASPARCEEILNESHIAFSLWEPTPENINQISTKFLESYSSGCRTICFDTPLYRQYLGDEYPFFIKDITQLEHAIDLAIGHLKAGREFIPDGYVLSQFSWANHTSILRSALSHNDGNANISKAFNESFDCIYGLYIDEEERASLNLLRELHGIDLKPFKGVDGRKDLMQAFTEYQGRSLEGDWELKSKKKRLSIGAFGHLASFTAMVNDAKKNNYRKILIIEADAIFHKNAFQIFMQNRPPNFKVLYLGAGKWQPNVTYSAGKDFYYPNKTTGTFAIALDHSVFDDCIDEWQKFFEPTDVALWHVTKRHEGSCFVLNPNPIIADVSRSKTTLRRSQIELSRKFDWELADYIIRKEYHINRFVNTMTIDLNYAGEHAELAVETPRGILRYKIGDMNKLIINDYVAKVNASNLLISDFVYSCND